MSNTTNKRRTQAQRRAESRQAVLDSACRLFGERGFANTSLEDIASDCGLTIRPIYHYFGNKKALFAAVNEVMEERIIDSMHIDADSDAMAGIVANWRAYLDLCDDPSFRRIVLIDSPNILGRERWGSSAVTQKVRSALKSDSPANEVEKFREELLNAVVMGAFAEAALTVAEAEDIAMAKDEAERLMVSLFSAIWNAREDG
jgi:AcrR family transcriptional regulator